MKLLPYKKIVLQPSLDTPDLTMRLSEHTEPYKGFRFDNYSKSSKLFVGNVHGKLFDIRPVFKGRNSFVPYIHGQIETKESENKITITMRLHYGVLLILLVFFVGMPLFWVFKYHDMTGIGIIVLMYAMTIYFFNDECNKARNALLAIIETSVDTENKFVTS